MNWKRPICIAEIGGNHEGSFDKAIELLDLALSTPVDIIKFQTYFADTLVEKKADKERWEHFKKFELTWEQHEELALKVTSSGRKYLTSIWDPEGYKKLAKYLEYVKIGSGDATSYTYLKAAARTNLPIVLSTGLCTFDEVKKSVEFLRNQNALYRSEDSLIVLQCTSMYPIPDSDANLGVMQTYRDLGVTVGYSDHTVGSEAIKAASLLGARMLEFHFSDDTKNQSFRDHLVSLDAKAVNDLYNYFDKCEVFIGSSKKEPAQSEIDSGHIESFRRGTYASRNLTVGHEISEHDLIEKRPQNDGLGFQELLGRRLKKQINEGSEINKDNLEP